jgi:hypothetical protein
MEAYIAFDHAYQEAVSAFKVASDTMSENDTLPLSSTRVVLRDATEACAKTLNYSGDLHWGHDRYYWYNDPYINEYQLNWN